MMQEFRAVVAATAVQDASRIGIIRDQPVAPLIRNMDSSEYSVAVFCSSIDFLGEHHGNGSP
jgi:hypothetical protein